jgi:predicted dehydrogenase
MFIPVIMGFGHCGRALHLRCLRTLSGGARGDIISADVHLVDPRPDAIAQEPTLAGHLRLPAASSLPPGVPVLHICTPPSEHLNCVREALALGYRFIILEKPMAPTLEDALQIRALARASHAVVLVVAVWLSSPLSRRVAELSSFSESGGCSELTIVHNKSRFSRSLARNGEHVFDIEMPHQLSLARSLMTNHPKLLAARTHDLVFNGERKASMASGVINLASPGGATARLVSNLNHPVRERSITVQLRDGRRLVGNFPVSGDDSFSQLFEYSTLDVLTRHDIFRDDPLSTCLDRCYQYLADLSIGGAPPTPAGTALDFNIEVVSLLHDAKQMASVSGPQPSRQERAAVLAS